MSLQTDSEPPDPPPSPWRWVVALALAGVALGAGWLVQQNEKNDPRAGKEIGVETPVPDEPPAAAATSKAPAVIAGPTPRPAVPARRPTATPTPAPTSPAVTPEGPRLRVTSDVPGAFVFLDCHYVGVTPLDTSDVSPGSYHLKVSAEGIGSVDRPLEVAATGATEITVKLREVRLDAAVDVVHKHAVGSCEGRLTATLAGLRFDTAHAGDAFVLPLDGMESFQVDYPKKNLRVKARGGRTWNFTTKAPTADPLYVFEREVTAALAKLATSQATSAR